MTSKLHVVVVVVVVHVVVKVHRCVPYMYIYCTFCTQNDTLHNYTRILLILIHRE